MYRLIILLFFSLFSFTAQSQNLSAKQFTEHCDSTGLVFTVPNGYVSIPVKSNGDLYYEYAVINGDKSMEVRYTIWPLQDRVSEYEQSLTDSNTTLINPNRIYEGIVQANMLNMTAGGNYNIGKFPTQAVKNEFNADAGGSCFFPFNCEFGEGYTYGQFIYLHKDDVADVIVTFLSSNKDDFSDLMMEGFYSLKFK